ncbi:GNAT family N-acetyltransferase [Actinospica sp. MGRD01-02]|uniref:GNAT family N-acetyltransferase n=1 Tax=Actinospica acidithermotolerans TaxID=2828514 RepID=A0A941EB73_9ACTN|nr:GNAT family N-acetyltransferase [Actinospica acidithermotolerans]MBR7825834.1 GNAT family N-acetyltransferase [Actinospica acidithermotolerans]
MRASTAMPTTLAADHAGLSAEQAIETDRFTLQLHPSRSDWTEIENWMSREGWDPGFGDASAILALDPGALVIGLLDATPISAISVLQVSGLYAVLGNYLVHPDYRGRGFGLATWRAALPHAGSRVVALDAVPDRVGTYEAAGFTPAHTTIGYHGTIRAGRIADARGIRPLEAGDSAAAAGLDALCSPFERSAFLAVWCAASGTRTLVYEDRRGQVVGFGAIRPSRSGYRIGPLIAETPQAAGALFDALTSPLEGEDVVLNVPEPNTSGCELARERGLLRASHTIRMYSHPVRPAALAHCYSIASLAWG